MEGRMKSVEDRIWETRKARINLERRLISYARLIDWLIPWYSVVLIALAIIPFPEHRNFANVSTVGAVLILVASVIASSQNYRIRALQIREQYIELDEIHYKLTKSTDDERERLVALYHERLKSTENHSNWDYLLLKVQCRNQRECSVPKPNFGEMVLYVARKLGGYLVVAALFCVLPAMATILLV
jgi:hypothetical protein